VEFNQENLTDFLKQEDNVGLNTYLTVLTCAVIRGLLLEMIRSHDTKYNNSSAGIPDNR
jgi:hypothetical protein